MIRNGHIQTVVGRYLVGPRVKLPAQYHEIEVDGDGGDRVVVLESVPVGWQPSGPTALLVLRMEIDPDPYGRVALRRAAEIRERHSFAAID